MRPLPPAPFLPDPAEVLRQANEEGFRQGMALVRKDQEARARIKRERKGSPESLFIEQDDQRTPSEEKDQAKIKLERGESPGLFIAEDNESNTTSRTAARTTLSSGPYAGLQAANKRKREDSDSDVDAEGESKTNFGPAKSTVKKGGVLKNVQIINTRTMNQGPNWYDNIDPRQKYSRGDLNNLKYFRTLLGNGKKETADGEDITRTIGKMRKRLHEIEFYTSLSPILVKKSGLLEDEGLSLVFENQVRGVNFPFDIRADADILFRKWMSGQLDPHLLRGIVTKKGAAKGEKVFKSHSIDPNFDGKVSSNYVGAGNLINGQWWPLQLCAKRDGAHGESEAGIHGQKDNGAYSVVISGGGYANVDEGDSVKYCGTQGTGSSPSAGTNLMLKAYETQQSVRLLRSASLPASNMYRPARGIRYDGLYRIISYEVLDPSTAMYRFSLSRRGAQDPIRHTGDGMIPSKAQILEFNKIREQIG